MTRRLAGVVVLALAILAVAVVPMINGRRAAGSAVAVDFPAPPAVGDCVLPPLPSTGSGGALLPEIPVTAVRFGPCAGDIAGEVVSLSDADPMASASDGSGSRRPCFDETAAYAGLNTSPGSLTFPGSPTNSQVEWMPTMGSRPSLIVPSQRERNAGRHWAACMAAPINHVTYEGSLRDAYSTGGFPDQFGLCWTGVDLDIKVDLVPCNEAHPAELLATGWIANRQVVPDGNIDASCVEIAGRIMRTKDPTLGGAVRVVLDPVRLDGADKPDDPLAVGCMVTPTGTAQLTGTVVGLGNSPAPLNR